MRKCEQKKLSFNLASDFDSRIMFEFRDKMLGDSTFFETFSFCGKEHFQRAYREYFHLSQQDVEFSFEDPEIEEKFESDEFYYSRDKLKIVVNVHRRLGVQTVQTKALFDALNYAGQNLQIQRKGCF